MLFGLTNGYEIDESFLCAFIGKFIVIYFDDILVYNKSIDGNIEHLCYVLNASKNENYMLI
jgi:hypothetical protein